LIAVNCEEPSRATVTAVGLDVAEDATVVEAVKEEPDAVLEERVDERLEAALEDTAEGTVDVDVDEPDGSELGWLTVEEVDVPE